MEFNINPYHDDFEQNAKDNNYLRILFKPGYSVQARELTQIQTILQNQIKSFGDHIFQDGSPVIGGNVTLDNKVSYIKLEETYNSEDIEVDQFVGKIVQHDSDPTLQAKVLASYFVSGGAPTLMVKYLSGREFSDSDTIKIAGTNTKAKLIISDASGFGTLVSINEGIFYVNGFFVKVNEQSTVASAYNQSANVKVGLEISDEIVDYVVDSTLLDPAQGAFNYQAPGADRYQFNLNLTTRPLTSGVDESSFFELMRVENGVVTKQVKYAIYSELEKTLARRTYDESGDYTVTPFPISVTNASNANNYVISIDPGKAYVKGFEFETIGTYKLQTEKPRAAVDTRSIVDFDIDSSYGNYLKVKNFRANSGLHITNLESVDLHLVTADKVNIGIVAAANTFQYSNTKIGTARVRNVQRDSYSIDASDTNFDGNGVYNIYLTDINIKPRIIGLSTANSSSSQVINLHPHAAATSNAYDGVKISVLPITLSAIANVTTANVLAYSTRVNANSTIAGTFLPPNVAVNDVIRVGDESRRVSFISAIGDYLLVDSPFTSTLVGTNATTNPVRVFRQNTYTSNVTNQNRTIVGYNGTTQLAYLDRPFDDNAVAAVGSVIQLNYGIKDVESIIEGNISSTSANSYANVSTLSKLNNGDVELFEGANRELIFRLPNQYVKQSSLTNVDYRYTKYLENRALTSGSTDITTSSGLDTGETIDWSPTASNIEDNIICIIKSTTDAANWPAGFILKSPSVTAIAGGIRVTTNSSVTALDIYVTVKKSNAHLTQRSKTLRQNTAYSLSPFNYPVSTAVTIDNAVTINGRSAVRVNINNGLIFITDPELTRIAPGDSINLFVPDVTKVRRILKGNATSEVVSTNYVDITDHFLIDYGQTDELYDHAKIILKQGYPAPNANLTVHVDLFQHSIATTSSFVSADSYYPSSLYGSEEIPVYVSPKTGVYFLRDCLDFRPIKQIGTLTGAVSGGLTPYPDSSTEIDFQYYLPRIDKLVLTKNKEFKLLKGTSSPTPIAPEDISDAMTLYTIHIPPYAASTKDFRIKYYDNKRYTMRDIGKIDKRVKAIEYYTALNSVETKATDDSIQYLDDGTEKEKYGIVGEGFNNYNIADYKNPDFTVTLSPSMMMPTAMNRVQALKSFEYSNARENNKTVTLSYTETPAITQNVTSNKLVSVAPFLFGTFNGLVKLTPELDFWISEELSPEIVRGPEVTKIVNEITHNEVIRETIVERQIIQTVQVPVTNTVYIITESPGVSPPAIPATSDEDVVVCNDYPPPPVIPQEPVEANTTNPTVYDVVIEPVVPVIDPVYTYTYSDNNTVAGTPLADIWGSGTSSGTVPIPVPVTSTTTSTTAAIPLIPVYGSGRGGSWDGGGFSSGRGFDFQLNTDRA